MRHGRFGVQNEIGLPDCQGRRKIFDIHTRELQEEGLLAKNVNLDQLAEMTDQYSGAEIEGLVKEASQFSMERLHVLDCPPEELRARKEGIVTMEDFLKAFRLQSKEETMSESVRRMYL